MQANRFSPLAAAIALLAIATPLRADDVPTVSPVLARMNEQLAQMGLNLRVTKAEFLALSSGGPVGITVVADDRDLWTPSQWVPYDTRRSADGRNIRYLVDQSDAAPNGGVGSAQAEAAIDRAMATWNAVPCANIPIVKQADTGADPDVIDGLLGFGAVGTPYLADVVHAGWMPPAFFEALFPGGGTSFLAVTLGMVLLDPASDNDVNKDHKFDTALREIYYNDYFTWGINANPPTADVESVALHEAGHGLSHGHFGFIFTGQDGRVQFAPFAVMNSVMFGQNHELQGTDTGGHCSIWAKWPNK